MYAAYKGSNHLVRKLLESGVNPFAEDANGKSALVHATERGHDDCAEAIKAAQLAWIESQAIASTTAGQAKGVDVGIRARSI